MRITLEGTRKSGRVEHDQPTVTIEVDDDDLSVTQVMEMMVLPALEGMGFHRDSIKSYFESWS